jgi:hypothetical protein
MKDTPGFGNAGCGRELKDPATHPQADALSLHPCGEGGGGHMDAGAVLERRVAGVYKTGATGLAKLEGTWVACQSFVQDMTCSAVHPPDPCRAGRPEIMGSVRGSCACEARVCRWTCVRISGCGPTPIPPLMARLVRADPWRPTLRPRPLARRHLPPARRGGVRGAWGLPR